MTWGAPPTRPYREGFSDKDLKDIKRQMIKIINKGYPLRREEVTREEAKRRIEEIGEPYKLEILDSIKTEPITIYHMGDWWCGLADIPCHVIEKLFEPSPLELHGI
jgi:threonyl-tRNA synthetase